MIKKYIAITLLLLASLGIYSQKSPKYIFYFIGDGMGPTQVRAASAFLQNKGEEDLSMLSFPVRNILTNHAEDNFITGSAASGTALATGHKTCMGTISMDCSKNLHLETLPEIFKKENKKVGIITSVSIDHATPAAFFAHQDIRNQYYEIALQLSESNFDFFAGGEFLMPNKSGKINAYEHTTKNGYSFVNSLQDLNKLDNTATKTYANIRKIAGTKDLQYTVDREEGYPNLATFTQAGINVLNTTKGFFLMVEGGKIDWACHANDAVTAIHEVIDFDKAIRKAVDFYNKHPEETLIIVTADHETGGFALGSAKMGYDNNFNVLNLQKASYEKFSAILSEMKTQKASLEMVKDSAKKYFSLGDKIKLEYFEEREFEQAYNLSFKNGKLSNKEHAELFGTYDPITVFCTQTLAKNAGISWTTFAHTGTFVPFFALGCGAEKFENIKDNTDITKTILEIVKVTD